MNTETNMLYDSIEVAEKIFKEKRKDLVPVPKHLDRTARRKLAGKQSAQVSVNSGGLLSRFANKLRNKKQQSC